jgi:hypothetical protein
LTDTSDYAFGMLLMAETADFVKLEHTHPFEVKETKLIRPRIIKQRINNQSGMFSVMSTADLKEKRFMDASEFYKAKLVKINLPG